MVIPRAADFGSDAASRIHVARSGPPVRVVALLVRRGVWIASDRRDVTEAENATPDPLFQVRHGSLLPSVYSACDIPMGRLQRFPKILRQRSSVHGFGVFAAEPITK